MEEVMCMSTRSYLLGRNMFKFAERDCGGGWMEHISRCEGSVYTISTPW